LPADDAVAAAMEVTDRFLATFNACDAPGHAATLLYPHVRFAGRGKTEWASEADAAREMAVSMKLLRERAEWDHSAWDHRNVIHAGTDKVHLDMQFTRYRADGSVIGVYPAVYVIERVDGAWGIRARSSFAP
jgi:hypothetical protein